MKKLIYIIVVSILALITLFFTISALLEHKPEPLEEAIYYPALEPQPESTLPDTLKFMTWNIGYAGLGDNMTFFMDGGKDIRDTKERTEENLHQIIEAIKVEKPDIVLLQEVDINSHRTYNINQAQILQEEFPQYHIYFAANLKSWFIPIPIKEPIGKTHSGVAIMTRFPADSAIRHQYPSKFPWPERMFNLKRCLLEAHFTLSDGQEFIVGNTHCSAFDDGSMRREEAEYLYRLLKSEKGGRYIVGGDWNMYPKGYKPSEKELNDKNFVVQQLPSDSLETIGVFSYNINRYTARYNDKPYDKETSTKTLIDFFFHSENISIDNLNTLEMEFKSSDHNPVVATISLQK